MDALTERQRIIAELADDIACGEFDGKFTTAFFLDTLMDDQRVNATDVAVLLCLNEFTDAHMNTQERLQNMVREAAVEFFTNDERGRDHINDKLAEAERERAADEEFERQYARSAA